MSSSTNYTLGDLQEKTGCPNTLRELKELKNANRTSKKAHLAELKNANEKYFLVLQN